MLFREQLMPALRRVAEWGTAALLLSAILAWLSARLVTRNLDVISNTIDRIRSGQMPMQQPAAGSSPTEFAAIESKLNLLGLQVRGAAELKGVVENLLGRMEEAILLFDAGQRLTLTGGALGGVLGLSEHTSDGAKFAAIFSLPTLRSEERSEWLVASAGS